MTMFNKFRIVLMLLLPALVLAISQQAYSQEHNIESIPSLIKKSIKLHKAGRKKDAIKIVEKILAIREETLGPEHPDVAESLNDLATLNYQIGDYSKAAFLLKRSLSISEKTFGPEHLKTAKFLNNLGYIFLIMGENNQAAPLLKRSLAISEKALGPEHPDLEDVLDSMAELHISLHEYTKAESFYKRLLAILEKTKGPESNDVTGLLNKLANLYKTMGNDKKAMLLYKKLLIAKEKTLGPEHPIIASILNNLAEQYRALGQLVEAEPLYLRSLDITKKAFGSEHPDVSRILCNLATLHKSLGKNEIAASYYERSLEIAEKALGPYHPDVAIIINNLAGLYDSKGEFTKAEALYKRSIEITEKLEPDNSILATSLNNLAKLYDSMGEYAKAEPLYKRSLDITEKALGHEHPDLVMRLNNLGSLYYAIGDYPKAFEFYARSLAIADKTLGEKHPDLAICLNNFALLFMDLHDYKKAEGLYNRSLSILEKSFGSEHPTVAATIGNLAELYKYKKEFAKAEALFKRSLDIREKALGPEDPNVAITLNNLGSLYNTLGEPAKAKPYFKRALTIIEKTLGPGHPDFSTGLSNYALLNIKLGEFMTAYSLLKKSIEIDNSLIDQIVGFTSEKQKINFIGLKKNNLHTFFSFALQYNDQNPELKKDALNFWVKRKGIILEAQKHFQDSLVINDSTLLVETAHELAKVRAQLSRIVFVGPEKKGLKVHERKILDLEIRKNELEARMSKLSQSFAIEQNKASADSEKVAMALPANTVLLEFAKIDIFNFDANGPEKKWLPAHYIAFILHAGNAANVEMIDLGDAEKIDQKVSKLKKMIQNTADIRGVRASIASKELYDLLFSPLKTVLKNKKEIFISPDGNLNLIPFEILQGPDGKFLIEEFTFNYLGTAREILGFGKTIVKGKSPVLIGDPDFDLGINEKDSKNADTLQMAGIESAVSKRSIDMRGFHFTKLSGTKEEVQIIQKLIGKDHADLYTGKEALEEVLVGKEPPSILHLATHGFFLEDLDYNLFIKAKIAQEFQSQTPNKMVEYALPLMKNPLLRSGIVLAGANKALQSEDPAESNGIVTAEKILGLRLQGTNMVVLSACETGLGEVKSGEGVYGLNRAFTQAGAKSVVMSMWSVPDQETKELMTAFYKNILSGKMNRCQALRQAMLNEMKIINNRYGQANPLFWGAFVFSGEP